MKCPACDFENPGESSFCNKCETRHLSSEKTSVSHTKTLQIPVRELTRGTVFAGRYEIIEELGKGGMGKVWEER